MNWENMQVGGEPREHCMFVLAEERANGALNSSCGPFCAQGRLGHPFLLQMRWQRLCKLHRRLRKLQRRLWQSPWRHSRLAWQPRRAHHPHRCHQLQEVRGPQPVLALADD